MEFKYILLMVLGMSISITAQGTGKCTRGRYKKMGGMCYKFSQDERNWTAAESECDRVGNGKLVSIITRYQYNSIANYTKTQSPGDYWLSGAVRNGDWVWTSNGSRVRIGWINAKIPSATENQCAYFNSATGKFWPSDCNDTRKYICQMDITIIPEVRNEASASDRYVPPPVDPERED